MCSTERSQPRRPIANGSLTSPISGPPKAGSTSRQWWISSRDRSSAGPGMRMTTQLVTDALVLAIWRRGKPEGVLHHSNRGSPYTSEPFQRLLANHGVTCSMSRAGAGTMRRWRASSPRSRPNGRRTRRTARETRPKRTCSMTSSASIIPGDGTRRWAI